MTHPLKQYFESLAASGQLIKLDLDTSPEEIAEKLHNVMHEGVKPTAEQKAKLKAHAEYHTHGTVPRVYTAKPYSVQAIQYHEDSPVNAVLFMVENNIPFYRCRENHYHVNIAEAGSPTLDFVQLDDEDWITSRNIDGEPVTDVYTCGEFCNDFSIGFPMGNTDEKSTEDEDDEEFGGGYSSDAPNIVGSEDDNES